MAPFILSRWSLDTPGPAQCERFDDRDAAQAAFDAATATAEATGEPVTYTLTEHTTDDDVRVLGTY